MRSCCSRKPPPHTARNHSATAGLTPLAAPLPPRLKPTAACVPRVLCCSDNHSHRCSLWALAQLPGEGVLPSTRAWRRNRFTASGRRGWVARCLRLHPACRRSVKLRLLGNVHRLSSLLQLQSEAVPSTSTGRRARRKDKASSGSETEDALGPLLEDELTQTMGDFAKWWSPVRPGLTTGSCYLPSATP